MWKNITDGDPRSWMGRNKEALRKWAFRDICILGSHDAAMSVLNAKLDPFSSEHNILTQSVSIYDQLNLGARYFDIRPAVLDDGHDAKIATHHSINLRLFPVGGFGQHFHSNFDENDIINDVNKFLQENPNEIVILKISHVASFYREYAHLERRAMTNACWRKLDESLMRITKPVKTAIATGDVGETPLGVFWDNGANVIIYFDEYPASLNLSGKDRYFKFNIYDEYSNTSNFDKMRANQIAKLKANAPTKFFLASWTLTQLNGNIREEASKANMRLGELTAEIENNPLVFPNIVYIDNIVNNDPYDHCLHITNIGCRPRSLNGRFVRATGAEWYKVHFVIDGKAHFIVAPSSFNAIFTPELPADKYMVNLPDKIMGLLPKGENIAIPILHRDSVTGKVYLIPDQPNPASKKYWIINPDTFNKSLFRWDAVKDYGSSETKRTDGSNITYMA
jgi:hypothetical protein